MDRKVAQFRLDVLIYNVEYVRNLPCTGILPTFSLSWLLWRIAVSTNYVL